MPESSDGWAAGTTYESYMGRWSRLLAPRFPAWLSVRPAANWLDVGCGTGALADAICAAANPASVVACDPSEPFIDYARRRQADPRISFVVSGVGQLPTRPGGFDGVASLLALNFFPKPGAAIDEMRRITARSGLVSDGSRIPSPARPTARSPWWPGLGRCGASRVSDLEAQKPSVR